MANYESVLDARVNLRLVVTDNAGSTYVELWLIRTSGTGRYSDFTNNSWSVNIDGQTASGSGKYDVRSGSQRILATTLYPARSAGARDISVSGSFSDPRGNVAAGSTGGAFTLAGFPSAPTIGTLTQNSLTEATLTWSAPSTNGGSAVTGYRVQYGTSATFTAATTLDVGLVTTRKLTGLTPGSKIYTRVAALNAVTSAASTSSAYSALLQLQLIAEIGDLDGWSSFGTLPAGLAPLAGDGLRRASVSPLGPGAPLGLLREIISTGSGSVTISTLGIQRTITGLTVGARYKLSATMIALETAAPGNVYRLGVVGIGTAGTAEAGASPVTLLDYTFTATATTHTLRAYLAESASWSGSGWFESVAFYGIKLTELPNTSPYRLQDIAYESSLASHFTLACDTVGAAWWVDRANVTRFRQAESQDAIVATFTDQREAGKREYVDIIASYDTANVVNVLKVNNHGRDAETGNAEDFTYSVSDTDSAAEWGTRAGSIEMSLWSPGGTEIGLRTAEILDNHSEPEITISTIRWNAQEDPALAATLDIQDRVRVEFRGRVQDSRILGIKHAMTPERWMVTMELAMG